MMARRNNSYTGNVHLAGEFFVAAELAKRGYAVSLTLGNAKAIDIYAERDGKTVAVQVKSRTNDTGWPMPLDPAKVIDGVPYVLVKLNGEDEAVEYFILTPEQVRAGMRRHGPRCTLYMAQAREGHGRWDILDGYARTVP
jgi:hypothetical protein